MLKAGLLTRDAVSHRTSQGGAARAAPATGPLTRPVVLPRAPTGFRLFEALIEPSAALLWLVACVRLGGDSFDSRYLIVATIAFSFAFPGAMRFNDPPRIAFAKALRAAVLLVSGLALIGYATGYLHLFPSEVALANSSDLCSASAWLLARCTTMGQE